MATHSSILAEKIPGTENPGGLWFTGLQCWTCLSDKHTQFTTLKKIKLLIKQDAINKMEIQHIDWEKMLMIHIICKRLEFVNYFYK